MSMLTGVGVLGLLFLGLALNGLYSGKLLVVLALLPFLFSPSVQELLRTRHVFPVPGLKRPPWIIVAFAIPSVLISMSWSAFPDTSPLGFSYHLAAPEKWIQTGKMCSDWSPFMFQYPMSAELLYGISLVLHNDASVHFVQMGFLVAGIWLIAEASALLSNSIAGWLVVAMAGTWAEVLSQAGQATNDLVLTGEILAALSMLLHDSPRGRPDRFRIAGLLLGVAAGTKWNGLPFCFAGMTVIACMEGYWGLISLSWPIVLFCSPWMLKSYLTFGDPVWPALLGVFPGALQSPATKMAVSILRSSGTAHSSLLRLLSVPIQGFIANQPAAALVLPLAIIGRRDRRPSLRGLLACISLSWIVLNELMPSEEIRLGLPIWIALCVPLAVALAGQRREGSLSKTTVAFVLAWGISSTTLAVVRASREHWTQRVPPVLLGEQKPEGYRHSVMTPYFEAASLLDQTAKGTRSISFGDMRSYRMPRHLLVDSVYGENWGWRFALESSSPDRLRIKCREANVRSLLVNTLGDRFPAAWQSAFPWSAHQLVVWHKFLKDYTTLAAATDHLDASSGGFVLLEVNSQLRDFRGAMPLLPGAQYLWLQITAGTDPWGRLVAARGVCRAFPDVQQAHDLYAIALGNLGRWEEAYRELLPGILHGWPDGYNYWDAARAAARTGRYRQASKWGEMAREMYRLGSTMNALIEANRRNGQSPSSKE